MIIKQAEQEWLQQLEAVILKEMSNIESKNAAIAKKLNITERTLYRKVYKYTGLTPYKYILNIRLKLAFQYLAEGNFLTVKEVAAEVGFKKTEYFSGLFKAKYGRNHIAVLRNKG